MKRLCVLLLVVACTSPAPPPVVVAPVPDAPVVAPPTAPLVRTLVLPSRLSSTTWRVTSTALLRATAPGAPAVEQRSTSNARVTWSLDRSNRGALRGTGQVDSFVVRGTLDTARSAVMPLANALVLLEATLDSAMVRVATRPPLANECDRQEAAAAQLAREVLVRIPDGIAVGARWRDSTVSLVCRSGVPMALYTVTESTLASLDDEVADIRREQRVRVDGRGGSPFRALDVSGTGSGSQQLRVRLRDGAIERLDGRSTLTLQMTERAPPAAPRTLQVVQQVELRVDRLTPR